MSTPARLRSWASALSIAARAKRPASISIDEAPKRSAWTLVKAPLDRIRAGTRVGFSCAFHAADLREFLHNHLFRYREYELMLAVRDTIRALDLEPVVCWRRFSGRYVLQLWERGASQVNQAA